MKKIFYFVYIICTIYICFLMFFDYSNYTIQKIESNKSKIVIDKPSQLSNEEFVSTLKGYAEDLNTDIMYSITKSSGNKISWSFYTTTNTRSFLNLGILNIENILMQYGAISTASQKNIYPLKGSNLFYDISIYSFDKISEYNLESCSYYIDKNKEKVFTELLSKNNFRTELLSDSLIANNFFSIRMLILPIIIISMTAIFWAISKRKDIICKKMVGYSRWNIILDDFKNQIIYFIGYGITIFTVNVTIVDFFYRNTFYDYIEFISFKAFSWIAYIIIIIELCNIVNVFCQDVLYLKGKKDSYDLYIITYLVKVILSFMVVMKLSIIVLEVFNIFSINRTNKEISKEIENYVILPVSSSAVSINQDNQLEFNRRLDLFYEDTVVKYNGILINTRNFRNVELSNSDSMAQKYGQNNITVNENYLKLNNIHDINGNVIDESFLLENKMNLLLPEGVDEKEIKKDYAKSLDIKIDDIQCIYYKEGEIIRTFNPSSGRGTNGIIENPIIEIYNPKYLKGQMLNYVSGQYYFLNIDNPNPYKEIKPLLKKRGIDSIILQTIYISNVFNNSISRLQLQLINDVITIAIYSVSLLLLIVYNSKVYFSLYEKQIAIKKLNGMGVVEIFRIPIFLIIIQYCIFMIISNKMSIGIENIVTVLILEVIIFLVTVTVKQSSHILDIVRGENV